MQKHLFPIIAFIALAGCANEEVPKASHFEHDHEVPHHWPVDLDDAVSKIRERLNPADAQVDQQHNSNDHHHADEHGHEHGDDHGHEHGDDHGHEHGDDHGHEHGDDHGHEHGDDHGHEHGDDHGHEHGDDHGHEHGDDHGHEHGGGEKNAQDQIADIVSWIPAIAADTNLPEQDWNQIESAANSLTAELNAAGGELTKAHRDQASALCQLIEQSLRNLPENLQH